MKKYFVLLIIALFLLTLLTASMVYWPSTVLADEIIVNKLTSKISGDIDAKVHQYDGNCSSSLLGVVYGGEIVYTKSYGNGHLTDEREWASVSKTLTALILMRLKELNINKYNSVKVDIYNNSIWDYTNKLDWKTFSGNPMPTYCADYPLTLKQIMTHTAGFYHSPNYPAPTPPQPIWENGKLNLMFCPGTSRSYSSDGFNVLGDIIASLTGTTYVQAVQNYIVIPMAKPTGQSNSLHAESGWWGPSAFVISNIEDFSLYTIGIMNNKFVSSTTLYEDMLTKQYSSYMGLGFQIENYGTDDLTAYHSGSNGGPRAFMFIKPKRKRSVVYFCQATSGSANVDTYNMTKSIDNIMVSITPSSSPGSPVTPTPTPACPLKSSGDFNCDGKINESDLNALLGKWMTNEKDLTGDGKVNESDLNKLLGNWKTL